MNTRMNRREALGTVGTWSTSMLAARAWAAPPKQRFRLARFSTDVTPPLGHPLLAGLRKPALNIVDPLSAHGVVIVGNGDPVVIVAVDWCEIRNDAYSAWREAIAAAADTTPSRVLLSSVHQHDAPLGDLAAQRIVGSRKLAIEICNPEYHARTVHGVAAAVKAAMHGAKDITHLGLGQAKVERVTSNRRYIDPSGKIRFDRGSATLHREGREAPEGIIDPWVKTLSFWNGDRPLAALSCYSVHPMSYYGQGGVSCDFVGIARRLRRQDDAKVHQVYLSGCSGNVTAGKYNDGSPTNRPILASQLHKGMRSAWDATRRVPLDQLNFRARDLRLEPRSSPGHLSEDYEKQLTAESPSTSQILAALGLSWRQRVAAGVPIDVPLLDFGPAQFLLLPAEAYVEYQLYAQQVRPESFVVVAGYGECGPGYIPTDQAREEGDSNLGTWCWVDPGSEARMKTVIRQVLNDA